MEFSVRVAGTVTQTGMDVPNRLSQHNGESREWDHMEIKFFLIRDGREIFLNPAIGLGHEQDRPDYITEK